MQRTIHFVGGEKGGVGKSVFARFLAQFFIDQYIPFVGFDADASHQSFARFYGEYASHLDLAKPDALDAVVEAALQDEPKQVVVDLPAQSARQFWQWLDEAEVLDLLGENEVRIVCWHLLDDSRDGVAMLGELVEKFGERANYVAVLNQGRGFAFDAFHQSSLGDQLRAKGGHVIELPKLNPGTMAKVDAADASFWAAVHNPESGQFSMMDRQRSKVWLRRASAGVKEVLGL
jgi:hypothetical protein